MRPTAVRLTVCLADSAFKPAPDFSENFYNLALDGLVEVPKAQPHHQKILQISVLTLFARSHF